MEGEIRIEPMRLEWTQRYLDYFSCHAFADGSPYAPCYCIAFYLQPEACSCWGDADAADIMRHQAEQLINEGKVHGYFAFSGEEIVGWCNCNVLDRYVRVGEFNPMEANTSHTKLMTEQSLPPDKVMSIVCLTVKPGWRGKGIATALVQRVLQDAQTDGLMAVEAYPIHRKQPTPLDFTGPEVLYQRLGFTTAAQDGNALRMRKYLNQPKE